MVKKDYFKDRDAENLQRLRRLRDELPEFCTRFFVGIESTTTVLTRLNYAYDLGVFFHFLLNNVKYFRGYRSVDDFELSDLDKLTVHHLEDFLEYLNSYEYNGKQLSNGEMGKERKISTVRTLYNYFYKRDLIEKNPASKVNLPKKHEKEIVRLDRNEMEELLDTVDLGLNLTPKQADFHDKTRTRDVAIVTLLLGTGIRVSECVGLNIEDFDFKNNAFTVTRKGGSRVILYFSDEVKEAIENWLETRSEIKGLDKEEPALFLSLQKKRISVRAVQILVQKYAKTAAPLKTITPHKLRSTYGTNLYRATHDIYVVAEVLGHRDVNTTKKHYAAISEDIRKAAADKVQLKSDSDDN